MIGLPQRLAFLKKSHLFHGLSDQDLEALAGQMEECTFLAGETIFKQGSREQALYFIFDGKVALQREVAGDVRTLAILGKGDYFGEEGAYLGRTRSASAQALTNVTLLMLDHKGEILRRLLRRHPHLRPNFEVAIESRRLARRLRFKWLRPREVIYFLARKHPIALYQSLTLPVILSIVPLGLLGLAFLPLFSPDGRIAMVPLAVGSLLLVLLSFWGLWLYVDWGNDYYIVTNERVIWMEKVVGIHESRMEAPITTVLSVGVEVDYWGRLLDYGNVIVRTFVGQIPFREVNHPRHAARMIEELWQRSKEASLGEEKEKMKAAIRARLGLPAPPPRTVIAESAAAEEIPAPSRPSHPILKALFSQYFTVRIDAGEIVTYRKHWAVFLRNIFSPIISFLALLGIFFFRLWTLWRDPRAALVTFSPFHIDFWSLILFFSFFVPIGLIFWRYLDWSNDIFQVTEEQIIDIDRTPFGKESRTAAPLENILSTEYRREGILANLFNFGTVYITVGGTKMAFEDVLDPAGVQADIDRRRMARMAKKKEAEAAIERERFANWLAVYHQSADELRNLEQGLSAKKE
ncbi:MAG: cyclic nucleotide-binding domain-containing protein [Anaerolineales bacterium]